MKTADLSTDLTLAAQWCKNWFVIFSVKLIFHRHRSNTEFSPVTIIGYAHHNTPCKSSPEIKSNWNIWSVAGKNRSDLGFRIFHRLLKRFLDIWIMLISPFRSSYLGLFPLLMTILSVLLQLVVSPFLQEYWRFENQNFRVGEDFW